MQIASPRPNSRHPAPPRSCHCEPVTDVTGAAIRVPPSAFRTAPTVVIPSQPSGWRGNPFPRPRAAGAAPLFTCCLRRGTFVTSDKSTQKRCLKLRFKTSSARYALCQACLMFLAQSPFLCTAVGQKDCAPTAFRYRFADAAPCHGSSFPLYRRTGEEGREKRIPTSLRSSE